MCMTSYLVSVIGVDSYEHDEMESSGFLGMVGYGVSTMGPKHLEWGNDTLGQ